MYYFLFNNLFIQVVYFFQANLTCLNVSWFNEENINLSKELELINKSYSNVAKNYFTPTEYLKNFNWFSFWLKRNFIEIFEHLLTIILPIILFLFFQKKKIEKKFVLNDKLGLYFFLILGFIILA